MVKRENSHARKKKKKSDSRFLNPNEPFGLGSIFNRGRRQFLAAVQFQPRQKITFGLGSFFNRGRKQVLAAVQFQPRQNITAVVTFLKY